MKSRGFTIVELLIVIVVIAILAAITIVAYNGIQQRGRDTQRKSDVAMITKALRMYDVDNGAMYTASGCGANGNGSGYFNYNYGSPGADMNECLKSGGYLSGIVKDPKNPNTCSLNSLECYKYLKYTCVIGGSKVTYVFANLESVAHTSTDTDGTCFASADTDYGMNYWTAIQHDR